MKFRIIILLVVLLSIAGCIESTTSKQFISESSYAELLNNLQTQCKQSMTQCEQTATETNGKYVKWSGEFAYIRNNEVQVKDNVSGFSITLHDINENTLLQLKQLHPQEIIFSGKIVYNYSNNYWLLTWMSSPQLYNAEIILPKPSETKFINPNLLVGKWEYEFNTVTGVEKDTFKFKEDGTGYHSLSSGTIVITFNYKVEGDVIILYNEQPCENPSCTKKIKYRIWENELLIGEVQTLYKKIY